MSPIEFCYWLQGHFELCDKKDQQVLTVSQTAMIREHLSLVFQKVTPVYAVIPSKQPLLCGDRPVFGVDPAWGKDFTGFVKFGDNVASC